MQGLPLNTRLFSDVSDLSSSSARSGSRLCAAHSSPSAAQPATPFSELSRLCPQSSLESISKPERSGSASSRLCDALSRSRQGHACGRPSRQLSELKASVSSRSRSPPPPARTAGGSAVSCWQLASRLCSGCPAAAPPPPLGWPPLRLRPKVTASSPSPSPSSACRVGLALDGVDVERENVVGRLLLLVASDDEAAAHVEGGDAEEDGAAGEER
eukprot:scaffold35472_cov54-Phaeocystis_antarctica.AAC.2